jgi:hypothetical protein
MQALPLSQQRRGTRYGLMKFYRLPITYSLSSKPIIVFLTISSRNEATAVQESARKMPLLYKRFPIYVETDNVHSHYNAVLNVSHTHLITVPMYFVREYDRISIQNINNMNLSSPE